MNESSNETVHPESDTKDIKVISIDGSCRGNGTDHAVGGFGIYWGENHPYNVSEKVPKSGNQTNQVAELMAAVRAVQQVRQKGFKEMIIQTDSIYVYNGITSWINKWIKSGWKTTQGKDVKHKELWQQLYDECQMGNISWEHVKGHSGNAENEGADRLASAATEDTEDRTDLFIPPSDREERDKTKLTEDLRKKCLKSISSQTYRSNLELHFEDLLTAFQSMESQVLNIVQKSYQEQRDSDLMVYKTEIKRLEDIETQMEVMLKREKKEREKVQRELKSLTEVHKSCDRQSSQAQSYEEKNRDLETQIQRLKEQSKQDMAAAKAQEEQIVALRKMSESTKRDLEYMTGRITQMNREMQTLQERNTRLSENELSC